MTLITCQDKNDITPYEEFLQGEKLKNLLTYLQTKDKLNSLNQEVVPMKNIA
jgi:hypothetical protein